MVAPVNTAAPPVLLLFLLGRLQPGWPLLSFCFVDSVLRPLFFRQVAARAAAALACSKLIYLTFASLVSARAPPTAAQPSAAEADAHAHQARGRDGSSDGGATAAAAVVAVAGAGVDGGSAGSDTARGRPDPLPLVQVSFFLFANLRLWHLSQARGASFKPASKACNRLGQLLQTRVPGLRRQGDCFANSRLWP
jgi:hypothetical protein